MSEKGYVSDIYRQLEAVMNKCDSLSLELKTIRKNVTLELNTRFDVERNNYEHTIENLSCKVKKLETENNMLKEKNDKLANEVDRLKSQINNDSNNSSLPPSTDIKPNKKDIPNNREKGSKKQGGQTGHKGYGLSKVQVQDKIKNNEIKHVVKDIGNLDYAYVSKYVLDISIDVVATEYRFHYDEDNKVSIPKEFHIDVQYGNEIKSICTFLNVQDNLAFNKVAEFITSITHNKLNLSNSTLVNFVKKLSKKGKGVLQQIESQLLNAKLMYTDGTTSRKNGKNNFIRNYSTERLTLLKASIGKGKKHIDKTGILTKYVNTLIHDHESVIYNYGDRHGECNVHITRYLVGNSQDTQNSWSKSLRNFLLSLNEYKKKLVLNKKEYVSREKLEKYSNRYDELLELGYEENKRIKGKIYAKNEKRLLNRLKKYKSNHLLFLEDFSVPFSNNLSERDLRHVKIKQKVSGGFRSDIGQDIYCDIKSIYITCRKLKKDIFNMTNDLYKNNPVTI